VNRDIICTECPWIYSDDQIIAYRDGEERPLSEVLGTNAAAAKQATTSGRGRMWQRLVAMDPDARSGVDVTGSSVTQRQRRTLENLDRLKDWTFKCPNNHVVEGNRGRQLPLAVLGPSGSSKSHFLAGLIWETGAERALHPWNISIRDGQFTAAGLTSAASALYRDGRQLPATPPDAVIGPFGYRLSTDASQRSSDFSLILYDVGGEALSEITRIREQAPFVLLSQAICVLIDPQKLLPSEFDPDGQAPSDRQRMIAAADVRAGIGRIADALEEIWELPIRDIPIPICFVIAKADSITWSFDFANETSLIADESRDGSLTTALCSSSERVIAAFRSNGGGLIVDEVYERFSSASVRFVAASATSKMPIEPTAGTDVVWDEAEPRGIALVLLHLLEMLGVLAERRSEGGAVLELER
jgi:hypothetical protein